MLRPMIRVVKFCASALTIDLTVKKQRAKRRSGLRPRVWEREAKVG